MDFSENQCFVLLLRAVMPRKFVKKKLVGFNWSNLLFLFFCILKNTITNYYIFRLFKKALAIAQGGGTVLPQQVLRICSSESLFVSKVPAFLAKNLRGLFLFIIWRLNYCCWFEQSVCKQGRKTSNARARRVHASQGGGKTSPRQNARPVIRRFQ